MDDTAKRPAADGCAACWAEEADAAWAAHRGLTAEARLVDESHFDVALLRCPACGQRFASVFTERIDWVNGEDPQFTVVLHFEAERARGGGERPRWTPWAPAGGRCALPADGAPDF
jgi:hypothetical protein